MKKCPICNRKLYEESGKRYCKNCKFVNDPTYLNEKKEINYEDLIPRDKKQKRLKDFEKK